MANGAEIEGVGHEKEAAPQAGSEKAVAAHVADDGSLDRLGDVVYPTDEELETLRHVHGKVDWLIYSIGVVELIERFAYYGTTAVCMFPPRSASSKSRTPGLHCPSA